MISFRRILRCRLLLACPSVALGSLCSLVLASNGWGQQGHVNPPALQVMSAENEITIDGRLNEQDWQRRIFSLNFKHQFKPDDGTFAVTGNVLPPEPEVNGAGNDGYTDVSSAQMMFLHRGTELYLGVLSNDSSVCKRFFSWEGDGLFMKVKNKAGLPLEYKLFYVNPEVSSSAKYETNGPAESGAGASYEFPGTVVNQDTIRNDAGYSLELVIHLDKLGYTERDSIPVVITIFDVDFIIGNRVPSPATADFYKSWWGSEWGLSDSEYRYLVLSDPPAVEALTANGNLTLDGQLNEPDWGNAHSLLLKPGSKDITGWWYMQWGDTLNSYDNPSGSRVKFLHKGTDVYIGIVSDDASVTNYALGWEADGAFIWMRDPFTIPDPGQRQEVKLMYFGGDVGTPAVFEVNGNVPTGGAEGVSYEPPGTVTRSETNGADAGYSLEIVIHADKWGYTATDTVWFGLVLWDMDHSSIDANDEHVRDYAKTWWGSEWADKNFDKFHMYRGIVLSSSVVGVAERSSDVPTEFRLAQNHPNPFNPETEIRFDLPVTSIAKLEIFNMLGQRVRTLQQGLRPTGSYRIVWDGRDDRGQQLGTGVYFYQLTTDRFTDTKKMLMVR